MSPYQRAAAVAVPSHPTSGRTGPVRTGRRRWPGHGDRAAQAAVGFSVAVVLAAMACTWLDVFLDLFAHDRTGLDAAVRTWALDAVTALTLGVAAVVHSAVRRGRPGRWPVTVLVVATASSAVLAPAFVA
ncbi:hypothetical protein TEK04_05925 [Klenkia sp. LSe6-5]|uniref:DUF2834 domain-containing protein n=1 Tax=Klenkia sesuvii TaxID=3103137 RepID=A0ABU8DR24_9ACTN